MGGQRIITGFAAAVVLAGLAAGCGSAAPRVTQLSLTCSPSAPVPGQSILCSAKVTSAGSSRPAGGTVAFAVTPAATFSARTCSLVPSTTYAACALPFTAGTGRYTVTGSYHGDKSHKMSQGQTTVAVLRPSRAAVACPAPRAASSKRVICSVTVTDGATAPTGTVTFTVNAPATFSNSGVCTLVAAGNHAGCKLSYRPVPGPQTISIAYSGDTIHAPVHAATTIAGRYGAVVTLRCTPAAVRSGHTTGCTVTVSGSGGAGAPPTGAVTFSAKPAGSFASAGRCKLVVSARSAKCTITYTPVAVGKQAVSAVYSGDRAHAQGSAKAAVSSPRSTSVTVTCSPAQLTARGSTTCTATAHDTAGGTKSTPAGKVTFSALPAGTFGSSGKCTLSAGSCKVTYTPVAGKQTITAAYGGDRNHAPSNGTATVTYTIATSTSVKCVPRTAGDACTATVSNAGLSSPTPSGTVTFTSSAHGSFRPSSTCTLRGSGASASCSVTYQPVAGKQTVSAGYGGDADHGSSKSKPTTVSS